MGKRHEFKFILIGALLGLLVGIFFSTLFVSQSFRIIAYNIPLIGVFIYNADIFWLRIVVAISLLILGSIIAWIVGKFKKEISPPTLGTWISLIFIFIILVGFYAFTFTVTYECNVATRGNAQQRDGCYVNKLICAKVNNQNLKDSCYVELAKYKVDLEICNNVLNSREKNHCVALVASQKSNPEVCENISNNETDKDFCYFAAASWRNPEICEKISGQSSQNSCYLTVGTQLCDESICQKITDTADGNLKLDCLATVARDKNDKYRPGGSCRFIQEERARLLESR